MFDCHYRYTFSNLGCMRRDIQEEVGQQRQIWGQTRWPWTLLLTVQSQSHGINILCVCMKVICCFGRIKRYQTQDLESVMYPDTPPPQTLTSALTTTGTFFLAMLTSLHSWFRLASETGSNCGTSPSLHANSLTQPCHPGVWMIWHTQYKHAYTYMHMTFSSPHIPPAIPAVAPRPHTSSNTLPAAHFTLAA